MRKFNIIFLLLISISLLNGQNNLIKVSSFNLRNDNKKDANNGNGWQNRHPVITGIILFNNLDIIGTQEGKNNQVNDLKIALSDYQYSYIGRGRGSNPTDDEYAAIFYKTDRFKLLNSGNFWLSETPDIPSVGWDAALNRICTWAQFEDKSTEFIFFAFNLHMDHIGVEARKNSSKLVIDKIKDLTNGKPVFLTGDFNVDQHSEGYRIITSSGLLSDSYLNSPIVYAPNGTFNSFKTSNVTDQRIDHIFISDHFSPTRYGILTEMYWSDKTGHRTCPEDLSNTTTDGTPRFPSDHYPVIVELRY